MASERLSQAAFARRLGVSRQYVNKLVARGVIHVGEDGLIDFARAVRAIEAAQDPARPRTRPETEAEDPEITTYQIARTLKEKYAALSRKLEYEKAYGKLLPIEEVTAGWQMLIMAFRSRVLAIPSKLAPRLVTMNERAAIQAALAGEIREALTELSEFSLPGDRPARPRGEPPAGNNGKSRPRRAREIPVH
jgi:hypothetical protein